MIKKITDLCEADRIIFQNFSREDVKLFYGENYEKLSEAVSVHQQKKPLVEESESRVINHATMLYQKLFNKTQNLEALKKEVLVSIRNNEQHPAVVALKKLAVKGIGDVSDVNASTKKIIDDAQSVLGLSDIPRAAFIRVMIALQKELKK